MGDSYEQTLYEASWLLLIEIYVTFDFVTVEM